MPKMRYPTHANQPRRPYHWGYRIRQVCREGLISLNGTKYKVPRDWAGHMVRIDQDPVTTRLWLCHEDMEIEIMPAISRDHRDQQPEQMEE